jgi:hypothetical protein
MRSKDIKLVKRTTSWLKRLQMRSKDYKCAQKTTNALKGLQLVEKTTNLLTPVVHYKLNCAKSITKVLTWLD